MATNSGAASQPSGGSDEQVWRELVARLEEPHDDVIEGAATGPKGVADFDPLGVWQQQIAPPPRELLAGEQGALADANASGPRDYEAEEGADEDGFVPAELPSLSGTEPAIMLSWLGAAGGPLFLVFAAIFWRSIPLLLTIGVIMAFLAGTGYLLSRLPNHRDHDSGDGAVV